MLSAASILGVADRLEQVDNVIACLCDSKGMATAVNKYFFARSRDGKGVPRHLISYEDAMEALTVVDHESGPSPTQGSFARFNSSPTLEDSQASSQQGCTACPHAYSPPAAPTAQPIQGDLRAPQWAQGTCARWSVLAVWQ